MLQSVSPRNDLSPEPAPDQPSAPPVGKGTLAPFTVVAFRIIWIANLFANLGTWAQSVAAAWVVTEAHSSPQVVAMIQVASALPLVLLSIVSGVLADNHDRRKIMLIGLVFEMSGAIFLTTITDIIGMGLMLALATMLVS